MKANGEVLPMFSWECASYLAVILVVYSIILSFFISKIWQGIGLVCKEASVHANTPDLIDFRYRHMN